MPRKTRIDAPGALHHIIVRGIEHRDIFLDNYDRQNLLKRLGDILSKSGTQCFAWALLPNHFHLLLETGEIPVAKVLQRLLTGYAVSFNRKHQRCGHLFQNRYKSILCQADTYLLELVRYIHLNPLRARLVENIQALDNYAFCGHGTILGRYKQTWQNTHAVLEMFADHKAPAQRKYRDYLQRGIHLGKRPDLSGGGLVRSAGGWEAVKALRKNGEFRKGDERILGDADFVEKTLAQAEEQMERNNRIQSHGLPLDEIVRQVADLMGMEPHEVFAAGRGRQMVRARSLACFWATAETTISQAELARRFTISQPAVSKAVSRGRKIAAEMKRAGFEDLRI